MKEEKSNINLEKIKKIALVILGLILIINIIFLASITQEYNKRTEESKEASRPADISLTIINPDTSFGSDINELISVIKKANVNIKEETTLTQTEASDLIAKYNVKKLPTVIITGEINRVKITGFEEKDSALIFNEQLPPYKDLTTNTVRGIVKLTSITDNTCKECYNVTAHEAVLDRFGVNIKDKETLDITQAKSLIDKYKIEKVPTIILTGDIEPYASLIQVWKQVGTVETDGAYVFRSVEQMGKIRDLTTGKVA